MELRDFYLKNIKESEYHYRFYDSIKNVNKRYNVFSGDYEANDYKFEVYDEEEVIEKFKELCQPEVDFANNEEVCWFYLVTYFLYKYNYEIKEFPRLLARPPQDPSDFVYRTIRDKIIEQGDDDNGIVHYATRRIFVANLTFEQKHDYVYIGDYLNQKFIEISTRQTSFNNMSIDEKLHEIANLIEYMLKKDGSYITLDYSAICLGCITEDDVKSYRNILQCFRHASEEAIEERNSYSDKQKDFLVDYGITILKALHSLL